MRRFAELDRQTQAFAEASGLQCPPGCGRCCTSPNVEATPLEMLPLAQELVGRGEAARWLEAVARAQTPVCVFYQPDAAVAGKGRCGVYAWRPVLCRLFGFAAVRNKQGQAELAACFQHKVTQPETVAAAQVAIQQGLAVPSFVEGAAQIETLDPAWGMQRLPINQALKMALEREALRAQLAGG